MDVHNYGKLPDGLVTSFSLIRSLNRLVVLVEIALNMQFSRLNGLSRKL